MPPAGSVEVTLNGADVLLRVLPNQYRPAGQATAESVCGGSLWKADS